MIAHSADPKRGIPAQSYRDHICGVHDLSLWHTRNMLRYYSYMRDLPIEFIISTASEHHDLGKLDAFNQEILSGARRGRLINHVDAGVAVLMRKHRETGNDAYLVAAALVEGHHIGFGNKSDDNLGWKFQDLRHPDYLRDRGFANRYDRLANIPGQFRTYTDTKISDYILAHHNEMGNALCRPPTKSCKFGDFGGIGTALSFRLMASCLVNADHADTARHAGGAAVVNDNSFESLKPGMRLKQLTDFVESKHSNTQRNKIRRAMFNDCCSCAIDSGWYMCDGYVGTGKTYAGLALALRLAEKYHSRHIILIAPYTAIIDQVVNAYADAIVLPGESRSDIVMAHHHCADYGGDQFIKAMTVQWFKPITITTAVQFFESLASYRTVPLKKLHNIPGSVIILDEFHNSIPIELWPLAAKWLRELTDHWGCKIILSSGSPLRLWDIPYLGVKQEVQEVVSPKTKQKMEGMERNRINAEKDDKHWDPQQFVDHVRKFSGPRIVVCNTIRNAAVLAQFHKQKFGQDKTEHLSTALTINDRRRVFERVLNRLKNVEDNDWTLFATSCVEAGVDFDFPTGFREKASTMSTIQIGGRVNREKSRRRRPVHIFSLDYGNALLTRNQQQFPAIDVQDRLWQMHGHIDPSMCTDAISQEYNTISVQKSIASLMELERCWDLKGVKSAFRVIDDMSKLILMDHKLFFHLVGGHFTSDHDDSPWMRYKGAFYRELMDNSCSVFFGKTESALYPVRRLSEFVTEEEFRSNNPMDVDYDGYDEVVIWDGAYDPDFLGYMAHVLRVIGMGVFDIPNTLNPAQVFLQIGMRKGNDEGGLIK